MSMRFIEASCPDEPHATTIPTDIEPSVFRLLAASSRGAEAILGGEPVGVSFARCRVRVAPVVHMADLMDEHVVQVEVADRVERPSQTPFASDLRPLAAEHAGFDQLLRCGWPSVRLHERCFHRVEVNVRSPLHSVQGKELTLASHRTELNDFNLASELCRKLCHACLDFIDGNGMQITLTGLLSDVFDPDSSLRFVPGFGSTEVR